MGWFERGQKAKNNGQTSVPPQGASQKEQTNFEKGHAHQTQKIDETKNGGTKK